MNIFVYMAYDFHSFILLFIVRSPYEIENEKPIKQNKLFVQVLKNVIVLLRTNVVLG
jgi:hypothetical protein